MGSSSETSDRNPVQELFEAAIEQPSSARAAFVEAACGGDDELASRVASLLRAHDAAEAVDFFGEDETAAQGDEPCDDRTIGPYRLLRLLGEGGFGEVYLARQDEPVVRKVALKLLKPGLDRGQVAARFAAERQALALMEHPSIARILDAGTTDDGQAYFVMEYVQGRPVTEYCDERNLEIRDRLELFEQICAAVQHAHQKGVIHRDLKPSNILVTEREDQPEPKVIDFGIAKALAQPLTDHTLHTGLRQLLGTPAYMSPEQARVGQGGIDTRTDIYSLGVVLYELLTGGTPFERRLEAAAEDLGEIQRVIREELPQRPSARIRGLGERAEDIAFRRRSEEKSLARLLEVDLDWIVLRALEKDRNRRYESAADLARDVRRHLDHEPVSARRPGTFYVLWKFVLRHQVAATTVVAVTTALLIGLVLATLGLNEASVQRDRAEAQLRDLYVTQARASRQSSKPGRRADSLSALLAAQELRPGDDLRNEMLATLTLPDVEKLTEAPAETPANGIGPHRRHHKLVRWEKPGFGTIFDALSGEVLQEIPCPDKPVAVAEFSPDGEFLLIGYQDGTLQVQDLARGEPALELPSGVFRTNGIAFDPSTPPRWLALSTGVDTVGIYDLPRGSLRGTLPATSGRCSLAASPDGRYLAFGESAVESEVVVWELATEVVERRIPSEAGLSRLAWSSDGSRLAGAGYDTNIYVWSTRSGKLERVLRGHQAAVVNLAFDPRCNLLASYGWDDTTRLWDLRSGEAFLDPLLQERLLGFGERLITRDAKHTVITWEINQARELRFTHSDTVFGAPSRIAISNDKRLLATAGTNGLRLWDSESLVQLEQLSDREARVAVFLPGRAGLLVGFADGLSRWDFLPRATGESSARLGSEHRILPFDRLRSLTVTPDGATVIAVDEQGVQWIDLQSREVTRRLPHYRGLAGTPSLSADGRWLFTGTWKGEPARFYDLESDEEVHRFPGSHVVGHFSPRDPLISVSDGTRHRIFANGTWELLHELPRNNSDDLAGSLSFAADGSFVAHAYSRYVTRLLDPRTGQELALLPHPRGTASSRMAISIDGTMLAAVSPSRTVMVWDLRRIREQLAEHGLDWSPR